MTQNILVETVRAKSQKFFYRKIKEEKFFKETVCSSAISREPNILQESHENKWQSAHFWPSEIRRIYVNIKIRPRNSFYATLSRHITLLFRNRKQIKRKPHHHHHHHNHIQTVFIRFLFNNCLSLHFERTKIRKKK